jgi:hypothetical protein
MAAIFLVIVLHGIVPSSLETHAQSTNSTWSTPVNLSNSGGTDDPAFVIDSNDIQHAIWKDAFAGYVYSRGDGDSWSIPQAAQVPFIIELELPRFLAGQQGNIYAFWRNELGELFSSTISGADFGIANTWSGAFRVAESALDFDVLVDDLGNIHLVYIRAFDSPEFPSGVYYRTLPTNTQAWSNGRLIYASKYYRSISPSEANVQISHQSVNNTPNLYLGWDDRSRKRVYFSGSQDGGSNWSEPVIVDGPEETSVNPSPFNIDIESNSLGVIAVWQSGQQGVICSVRYRYSSDNGLTWSPIQRTLENLSGCPSENRFMTTSSDQVLMYTNIFEQIIFSAWDGVRWSNPQIQANLTTFPNPDTKAGIDFRCHQEFSEDEESLYMIGCDIGQEKDIWLQKLTFGDLESWFDLPDNWQPPNSIFTAGENPEHPLLVGDNQNQIHALWSVANEIYYTRKRNDQWLVPEPILRGAGIKITGLSAQDDMNGKLHIVYADSQSGTIFYAWADANVGINASEWSNPIQIPTPAGTVSGPQISIDSRGILYVFYSLSFNDNRGVYMANSPDNGTTWSQPILIFDAQIAGWEGVTRAFGTTTEDGHLHVLFTQTTTPAGEGPISLNYTQSSDGGQTWSPLSTVTEQPFYWSSLISSGGLDVHRFWQGSEDQRLSLWHDYSFDSGVIWLQSPELSSLGQLPGLVSTTSDNFGKPIVVLVFVDAANEYNLLLWVFENGVWSTKDTLKLGRADELNITAISSTVAANNQINVILSMENLTGADLETRFSLNTTNILLEESVIQLPTPPPSEASPTVAPAPENTPGVTQPPGELLTETPSETPDLSQINDQPGGSVQSGSQIQVFAISGILAIITIGAMIFIGLKNRSRNL